MADRPFTVVAGQLLDHDQAHDINRALDELADLRQALIIRRSHITRADADEICAGLADYQPDGGPDTRCGDRSPQTMPGAEVQHCQAPAGHTGDHRSGPTWWGPLDDEPMPSAPPSPWGTDWPMPSVRPMPPDHDILTSDIQETDRG